MISNALVRETQEFVNLIESHLAPLIHIGQRHTARMSRQRHERLIQDALVVAWRRREHLDPLNEPVSTWFERCLYVARTEEIVPDIDEQYMLAVLSPAPSAVGSSTSGSSQEGLSTTTAAPDSPGSDATIKIGRDCPPCWRCKYHQGWLPKRWPYGENWNPRNEMDLICKIIDERKVEIAKYVQGAYDPALLED